MNGVKCRPPRYYDIQYERTCVREFSSILSFTDSERIKHARVVLAKTHAFDNTSERLKVREEVSLSRLAQLKRGLT